MSSSYYSSVPPLLISIGRYRFRIRLEFGNRMSGTFIIKMSPYVREKMNRTGKWYRRDTFRSQGKGGQNVNKVESAVRLTDLTTGLSAAAQDTRDQGKNQALAFRRLVNKMVEFYRKEEFSLVIEDNHPQLAIRTYNFKRNQVKDNRTGASYPLDEILNGELDRMLEELLIMKAKIDAAT